MNRESIVNAINIGNIEWRQHALERMFQRAISRNEVKLAIKNGEIIEEYENDMPFPSALFFHCGSKIIHVVASFDEETKIVYVITAYVPDSQYFNDDLKTRRQNGN